MKRLILLLLLTLPWALHAQSSLYKRYAQQAGLTVAQVSDFRLNDSTCIDVVMVQANTDSDWQRLVDELEIDDASGNTSWLASPTRPSHRVRWDGHPLMRVVASFDRRTVGFYLLNNEQQYDALVDFQMAAIQQRKRK